jgi:hypothetical protein
MRRIFTRVQETGSATDLQGARPEAIATAHRAGLLQDTYRRRPT